MEFKVNFYTAKDGTKPMGVFLKNMKLKQPELHDLLTAGLVKIRNRDNHKPPLTVLVDEEHDLFELRVGRKDIARAFFFFRSGQEVIVTNGYVKKSQKVDARELKTAQAYKRDWERRFP